jgi:hypothetical protein
MQDATSPGTGRRTKFVATACFSLYLLSFLFPAATTVCGYKGCQGYEAAWDLLLLPFKNPAHVAEHPFRALLAWPSNPLLVAAFVLLSLGRPAYTPYLMAYALAGQLYWWLLSGFELREIGFGYWLWLAAGAGLSLTSIFAAIHARRCRVDVVRGSPGP